MKTRILFLIILATLFTVACEEDDVVKTSIVDVVLQMPKDVENPELKSCIVTLKNINTGVSVEHTMKELSLKGIRLEDGLYNVVVKGTGSYSYHNQSIETDLRGLGENLTIKGGKSVLKIDVFLVKKDFDESDLSLSLELPKELDVNKIKSKLVLKNVKTGYVEEQVIEGAKLEDFKVDDGVYDITVTVIEGADKTDGIYMGQKKSVEIKGGKGSVSISIMFYGENAGKGFVISEIFYAGTRTTDNKQYQGGDQFFEIYNNSDKVLYADGLCIGETELNTSQKMNEYTPDVRGESVPVSAVYRIPGTGKEHPVKPGETLLLCDVAINHKKDNTNSFDLTIADFEWFDGTEAEDVDVPEVENLYKMVAKSNTVWNPHKKGYDSFVLFRLDENISAEQFTTDYAYHYKYHFVFGDYEKWMDFDAWKIPNSSVIDAVECSVPDDFEWKALSEKLDFSWTYVEAYGGGIAYRRSVKRKISHKFLLEDGKEMYVLQDTNDSKEDFINSAENPSPKSIEDHIE